MLVACQESSSRGHRPDTLPLGAMNTQHNEATTIYDAKATKRDLKRIMNMNAHYERYPCL
jgi:hypothetical protein